MRYLGIDFGTKKIGLALSDEMGVMGFPHSVIVNNELLLQTIVDLVREQKVGTVVVGESLNSVGTENKVAKEARAFGARLHEVIDIPVVYEMEAFTTQEARRDLSGRHPQHVPNIQRHRVPKGARGEEGSHVDASAAALILTSYLTRIISPTSHDND